MDDIDLINIKIINDDNNKFFDEDRIIVNNNNKIIKEILHIMVDDIVKINNFYKKNKLLSKFTNNNIYKQIKSYKIYDDMDHIDIKKLNYSDKSSYIIDMLNKHYCEICYDNSQKIIKKFSKIIETINIDQIYKYINNVYVFNIWLMKDNIFIELNTLSFIFYLS